MLHKKLHPKMSNISQHMSWCLLVNSCYGDAQCVVQHISKTTLSAVVVRGEDGVSGEGRLASDL